MPKESTTEIETAYREYRSTVLEIYRHIVLSKFSAEKLSRKKISEMEAALQDELTSLLGHLDTVVWDRSDSGTPPFRLKLPSGEVVNKVSVLEKYVSKLMPDLEREYQAAKSPPICSWDNCKYGEFTAPGEEQDKLKELFCKQWEEYKETYKELFLEEGEKQKRRTSVTVTIGEVDIELTKTEALCLLALVDAVNEKIVYITREIIAERVWPSKRRTVRTDRLKPHWSNLKKKLKGTCSLPDFKMKAIDDGPEEYQLGKPPTWLKDVVFPRGFRLP